MEIDYVRDIFRQNALKSAGAISRRTYEIRASARQAAITRAAGSAGRTYLPADLKELLLREGEQSLMAIKRLLDHGATNYSSAVYPKLLGVPRSLMEKLARRKWVIGSKDRTGTVSYTHLTLPTN